MTPPPPREAELADTIARHEDETSVQRDAYDAMAKELAASRVANAAIREQVDFWHIEANKATDECTTALNALQATRQQLAEREAELAEAKATWEQTYLSMMASDENLRAAIDAAESDRVAGIRVALNEVEKPTSIACGAPGSEMRRAWDLGKRLAELETQLEQAISVACSVSNDAERALREAGLL